MGVSREGNASKSSSSFLSLAPKVRASPFPLPPLLPWDVKERQLLSPQLEMKGGPERTRELEPKMLYEARSGFDKKNQTLSRFFLSFVTLPDRFFLARKPFACTDIFYIARGVFSLTSAFPEDGFLY